MTIDDEIRRIEHGPASNELPTMLDRIDFSGDADTIIHRARTVLLAVLRRVDDWPAENEWRLVLPDWFVAVCAPEWTSAEAELWLTRWRKLTREEQALSTERAPWSLLNWLHWFDQSGGGRDRGWRWWTAGSDAIGSGWLEVEIGGHPYGSGELRWLLRAAGATAIS